MIDMVFLLLVFFMTVSTMAKDARPEIDLPVSTTAAVPEAAPPRDIVSVKRGENGFIYHWGRYGAFVAWRAGTAVESMGGITQSLS
jgi:biopolymer transport protein ExbD